MSEKLIFSLLLVSTLTACALQTPPLPPPPAVSTCDCAEPYRQMGDWLAMERNTSAMETTDVVAELVKLGRPEGANELFYFGVLNQKLATASNWRQARDAFRAVRKNEALTYEQRSIAALLERYNIYRLDDNKDRNDLLREQEELKRALEQATQDNALLQEKIQAITDLEADMSTRIEQEQ